MPRRTKVDPTKCNYCQRTDHVYKDCPMAKRWKAGKGSVKDGKAVRTRAKMLKRRAATGRKVVRLSAVRPRLEDLEAELQAMNTAYKVLQPLNETERYRVMNWLIERLNLGLSLTPKAGKAGEIGDGRRSP